MKFAQRVEERNLCRRSSKSEMWGHHSLGMGWAQSSFPNGPQGGEQSIVPTGQPNPPIRPTTTSVFGF